MNGGDLTSFAVEMSAKLITALMKNSVVMLKHRLKTTKKRELYVTAIS